MTTEINNNNNNNNNTNNINILCDELINDLIKNTTKYFKNIMKHKQTELLKNIIKEYNNVDYEYIYKKYILNKAQTHYIIEDNNTNSINCIAIKKDGKRCTRRRIFSDSRHLCGLHINYPGVKTIIDYDNTT